MKLRLDKMLSNMGKGSRNDVKNSIRRGQVSVNGIPARSGSQLIDPEFDQVVFQGEPVRYIPYVYLMLNKPAGYLCATEDRVHPTVVSLVPEAYSHYRVFPVGRLDIDTTGLLILTNDGAFSHSITSPVREVQKVYEALLDRPIGEEETEALIRGVDIDTKKGRVEVRAVSVVAVGKSTFHLTITEGKFHQVKKMFEAVGRTVLALRRIRIGGLALDESLSEGEVRVLTEQECGSIFE